MHHWTLLFLLLMNPFGRPTHAQSDAMTVVTLPPATAVSPVATGAPATSTPTTPTADASVLYPTSNPVVNNIDTLIVSYNTPWEKVDMIVHCGASAFEDQNLYTFEVNDLPQSGPHDLNPIQQTLNPQKYPIYCHITLRDSSNAQNVVNSGQFVMTSTGGSPTRYAISTTVAVAAAASNFGANTGAAAAASTTASDESSKSSIQTGSGTLSPNPTAETGSGTSSGHSNLSSGAKAGIALAVIISLALLALFIFLLLRYRRRLARTESELETAKVDAVAQAAQHASEKAYLDSILQVAGKPDTAHGGKIVVANLGDRESGDWRQFFTSKANSARQAVSSVGSRGNSRPSSKRGSKAPSQLGTAGGGGVRSVPIAPSLPSPSLMGDSVQGEGSTVGLVSGTEKKK